VNEADVNTRQEMRYVTSRSAYSSHVIAQR